MKNLPKPVVCEKLLEKNFILKKMFKMTGHFDILTNMFIAKCVPILQEVIIKKNVFEPDPTCFSILLKLTLKISELDVNCVNILGYEKDELINKKSLYDLIEVKYLKVIKDHHKSGIKITKSNTV